MHNEKKIKKTPRFFHWTTVFNENQSKTIFRFDCKSCNLRPECNLYMYKDKYNSCPMTIYVREQFKNHIFGEASTSFCDVFYLDCIQESPEIKTILHEMGPKIKKYYQKQL